MIFLPDSGLPKKKPPHEEAATLQQPAMEAMPD